MAGHDRSLSGALALLLLLAALAGCQLPAPYRATPPPPAVPAPGPAPRTVATPAPAPATPPASEHHLGAAAQSLVTQARSQIAHGELTSATVTLERAQRIEPANPLLWIELARLGLAAGDARRAEGYARKALALVGNDRAARALAGRVLAETLHAQHRDQEAHELESQPWMN